MALGDHPDGDGESSNPISVGANLAAHMAVGAPGHAPFPGGHQFRNQQLPSGLDPAVVNAAATIAVATAQAVHQVHNTLGAQATPASIAASLADHRNSLLGRQANIPSVAQIAALLSNPGMFASPFGVNHQTLQQFMNLGGSMQSQQSQVSMPTSAAAVAPTATVSSAQAQNMQSWSVEELGKKDTTGQQEQQRTCRLIFFDAYQQLTLASFQIFKFLEKHVALLQQLNRPVPQYVGLLLTEARRKQKKKHAKRIANRRSASTSRARKKKYVEEMKVTNARLKRQALILSLLPDLVMAINTDGEITFCSAQVERVLKHKIDDLIGANFSTLLVPASRDALVSLISEMVNGEKEEPSPENAQPADVDLETKRRRIEKRESGADTDRAKVVRNGDGGNGSGSGRTSEHPSNPAIVSEQSFPLTVVEVDSKQARRSADRINTEQNEGSDASTNNSNGKAQMSSLTTSTRSPTVSSGDEKAAREGGSRGSNDGSANAKRAPSSDDSSSLSSDAKNMSKANENLNRNVRRHNQKMFEDSKKKMGHDGPKDDVTGASVTANNATARLSSLKHVPDSSKNKEEKGSRYESNGDQSSSDDSLLAGVEEKKKAAENASDDSGYRESNDSREETSSSGSDTSNSNGMFDENAPCQDSPPYVEGNSQSSADNAGLQKKPLAATCRMCLIRQDLTTVWCEVTSSVRTRLTDEESFDTPSNPSKSSTGPQDPPPAPTAPKEDLLEILLCLRPIRNGEKRVGESLRFVPVERAETTMEATMDEGDTGEPIVSSSKFVSGSGSGSGSGGSGSGSKDIEITSKRTLPEDDDAKPKSKKQKTAEKGKPSPLDTETAVESLMCLNKSSQ